jgi:SAM-dependent methyltransferase
MSNDRNEQTIPGAQVSPRWAKWRAELPIDQYEDRFAAIERAGAVVHGEADFIASYRPRRVLDAGCGTGRVAIELARRGIECVGVDLDGDMLAAAAGKAPAITWIEADLAGLESHPGLGPRFDVVAMPGNVMLFCRPADRTAIVASLAALLVPGGRLISGFSLGQGVTVDSYDRYCRAAGLLLEQRAATWDGAPFILTGEHASEYVVAVYTAVPAP